MNTQSFKIKHSLVTLLLLAVFLVSSCSQDQNKQNNSAGKPKTQQKSVLATAPVQFINPAYALSAPAELKPYEQVEIYGKVTGFIKKLYVERGDVVKKGQLLAMLEAPEVNQKYLSDQSIQDKVYSDYVFSKQQYERLLEAAETTGAVASIELDRAKSRMMSDKSAHESSKAGTAQSSQLKEYLRITAPFDGIITNKYLSVGALVGTGGNQPLLAIAQSDRLRLTLSLPEKHTGSIEKGMEIKFTVSSRPGKLYHAKLSRTAGLLNQQDRSLTLEFDVNNSKGELRGGDYAQIKLNLKRTEPTFWVLSKSVLRAQSGTFIMSLSKDSTIKRIPVKEGVQLDSLTEVFGDIKLNEAILKKPSEELKEGKLNNFNN